MDRDKSIEKEKAERSSDDKCTAGNLPENQEQFEDTTWVKNADHGSAATEAERKNVNRTLPDSASKDQ